MINLMKLLFVFIALFLLSSCLDLEQDNQNKSQKESTDLDIKNHLNKSSKVIKDPKKCKQFHKLIKKFEYKEAISLIDETFDVNCLSKSGEIPVIAINRTTKPESAQKLFNIVISHPNFNANAENSKKENSLFAILLSLEEIKTLVNKGADINKINCFGKTPLDALRFPGINILEQVKYYIEHKHYKKNQEALNEMLRLEDDPVVLNYLISKGALVTFYPHSNNDSPLHNLVGKHALEKAKIILQQAKKQGLDLKKFINSQIKITNGMNPEYDGDTALHFLVRDLPTTIPFVDHRKFEEELIENLLAWGADPDLKNNSGLSARKIAKDKGYILPTVPSKKFPD